MPNCKAIKTNGEACSAWATKSGFCFAHDPDRTGERAAARKLGGLRRRAGHNGDPGRMPAEIRTLAGVLALLDYCKDEILPLENSIARARLLIALAGEYRATIIKGELEERIEALEKAINGKQPR